MGDVGSEIKQKKCAAMNMEIVKNDLVTFISRPFRIFVSAA